MYIRLGDVFDDVRMPIVKTHCVVCGESIFKRTCMNAKCTECFNEIHMPCLARLVLVDGMREGCFACDSKDPMTDDMLAALQKRVAEGMPIYRTTDERVVHLEEFIKTELSDVKAQLAEIIAKLTS